MEQGLRSAERVVAVCSHKYVERANSGKGGVGYEKMIVTAELIENSTKKFIPIVPQAGVPPVPTFLGYRLYIDFEDDAKHPTSLESLVRELLNVPNPGKPPIGSSPFTADGSGAVVVGLAPTEPSVTQAEPQATTAPGHLNLDIGPTVKKLKRLFAAVPPATPERPCAPDRKTQRGRRSMLPIYSTTQFTRPKKTWFDASWPRTMPWPYLNVCSL